MLGESRDPFHVFWGSTSDFLGTHAIINLTIKTFSLHFAAPRAIRKNARTHERHWMDGAFARGGNARARTTGPPRPPTLDANHTQSHT
eukprot:7007625-Pyramimonas_sp.AAC.1